MEEPNLHSCLILCFLFFFNFKVKAGSFAVNVKSLKDSISASCLTGDGQIQISPLFPIWEAQSLRCWYRSWSGAWGGREHLLFLWLKLFHCAETVSSVCTVTWHREICIPFLLLHFSVCFYVEKSLDNIRKILSDPMFFVSTFSLIGLCASALRRSNPYQK